MIDWSVVFESAKPAPGASAAEIAAFVASLALPADRPLPPSYLSFLRYSDGGEFRNGERVLRMYCTQQIPQRMIDYHLAELMPRAVPFAANINGVGLYTFDMRDPPDADGEYPVISAAVGGPPFDPLYNPRIATGFPQACRDRFRPERLLHGGVVLTADQWDVWTDLRPMIEECRARDRKLRLFACACARRVWDRMSAHPSRRAVELAEQLADESVTRDGYRSLLQECERAEMSRDLSSAARAGVSCVVNSSWLAAHGVSRCAAEVEARTSEGPALLAARAKQADLMREIFGNPLRPVSVDPAWLAWNNRTVPLLADRIYEQQSYGDLPVLADAVEEAGCTNAELLAHLREPREHVRGCWALDLLRGPPI